MHFFHINEVFFLIKKVFRTRKKPAKNKVNLKKKGKRKEKQFWNIFYVYIYLF